MHPSSIASMRARLFKLATAKVDRIDRASFSLSTDTLNARLKHIELPRFTLISSTYSSCIDDDDTPVIVRVNGCTDESTRSGGLATDWDGLTSRLSLDFMIELCKLNSSKKSRVGGERSYVIMDC
jgi:hypothetical protein